MDENNSNNGDPFFNVEPLHGNANNNESSMANDNSYNTNNTNNMGNDPFSNVEPLQRNNMANSPNNQNTDYLNNTEPEINKTIDGRKFVAGNSAFSTYAVILFALSLLNEFVTGTDMKSISLFDGDEYVKYFSIVGLKVAAFVIVVSVISLFIAFIKKYTNENGLAVFKRYNTIYFGVWGVLNIITRVKAYLNVVERVNSIPTDSFIDDLVDKMMKGVRTGVLLNTIIVVGGMALAMFVVNKIVEKKFTIKQENNT